jgi:hypothetical protein
MGGWKEEDCKCRTKLKGLGNWRRGKQQQQQQKMWRKSEGEGKSMKGGREEAERSQEEKNREEGGKAAVPFTWPNCLLLPSGHDVSEGEGIVVEANGGKAG